MCRVEWHEGLSCRDYRELKGYPPEDRAFYKFIKGTRFKQCPQCKFWVEKSSGCNHMTCRCGYQFCYRCGGKYRDIIFNIQMNKPAKKLVKNAKPSSKSIFGDIASLQNYDPVLLFLIGYNYAKFEATNSDPNFVSIAGELQKALSQLGNTSGDRLEIYDRLYSQENLNEVLSLRCLQSKVVKAKAPNKQNSNRAKYPKSEARARQPNAVVQNNGSEMYPELGEFRNPALPLYDFEPVNVYPAFLQENFGNEDAKIAPEMPVQK